MSREWKPGEVALIEVGCHANRHVGLSVARGWRYADDKWASADPAIVTARPLVVIDPENREAVERLALSIKPCRLAGGLHICSTIECTAERIADALREFANPTPPKPDEPTGLAAVVEDEKGARWTRVKDGFAWRWRDDRLGEQTTWPYIAAVRILSPGVES